MIDDVNQEKMSKSTKIQMKNSLGDNIESSNEEENELSNSRKRRKS